MTAAVLSIGTELTRGELVNTNAQWLAEQLTGLGFPVVEHVSVEDDSSRIVATLRRLAGEVSILVSTGGLGPTSDDLTADAVAGMLGVPLVRDEATLAHIRKRFAGLGLPMPEINATQADFPQGAAILPNEVGTAPGFAVGLARAQAFFLPGVPREMRHIFEAHVVPRIEALAPRNSHQIHLRTFGMTESQVAELLSPIEAGAPDVTLGYRAHFPEIEVKVLARGEQAEAARSRAEQVAEQVRACLGDAVFGGRQTRFAGWVGDLLRRHGLKLAVAESCTGGLIGAMLTEVPGSSDYLVLDAVTYANEAKVELLGVPPAALDAHGAVSAEVAQAMAEGVLARAGADIAVAVTGIAGPGGGTPDKPVGTVWLGIAEKGPDGETLSRATHRKLWGSREQVRVLSAYVALRLVARAVLRREGAGSDVSRSVWERGYRPGGAS